MGERVDIHLGLEESFAFCFFNDKSKNCGKEQKKKKEKTG